MLADNADENNKFLRDNYDWFSDPSKVYMEVFKLHRESPVFKNRLAYNYTLTYNNYAVILKAILDWERETIAALSQRIEESEE